MIRIRRMTERDDIAVSQIVAECYRLIAEPDGITADQLDRLLNERCRPEHMSVNRERFTCYVAEVEESVVGFIAVSKGSIEELFVHPAYHRQGIATALFKKIEVDSQEPVLTVSTTGFGVPFYGSVGMKIVGRKQVTFGPLEGMNLIHLEKRR